MPMYTLGHDFVPPPVHAGGLRYHGDSPRLSALVNEGLVEPVAISQTSAFDAALTLRAHRGDHPGARGLARAARRFDEAEAARERARSG